MNEVVREWAVEIVPIDSIRPHPRNYREHDLGAIHESIRRFGLYLPVLVQRATGYIVAGSGRWEAMQQRGAAEIPARFEDFTDAEALAILVADNWIPTRGRNLDPELLELLQELRQDEELFTAAGVEDDDLEDLARDVEEAEKSLRLDSRKMVRKPRTITCPECGHKWQEAKK